MKFELAIYIKDSQNQPHMLINKFKSHFYLLRITRDLSRPINRMLKADRRLSPVFLTDTGLYRLKGLCTTI